MITRLFSTTATLLVVLGLLATTAGTAAAYEPVNIVHTERVQAGPYGLTVGFSEWPLRALQSLDFTFIPDGGIADKSGTVAEIPPGGTDGWDEPLSRHPRKRDVWGLDVRSLEQEGPWTFRFVIDGPLGRGEGELRDLAVLPQPGPPLALSWTLSSLPLLGLIGFLAYAWRRTRPVPQG
ncbi:hypothetical protein [Nocardia crassostreae]|uniref:hypothetical protein n=1 Tax=Nocardia crassostreae TaxID=53428 RepID=UPI000829A3F6|nr:hypothetical protein [Nocardia crassostreae]